jgi:hypothetical protein
MPYWLWAVIIGVVGLLNAAVLAVHSSTSKVSPILDYILYAAILVVALLAGRRAKQIGGRTWWQGAQMGIIYGVISAIGAFFQHTTLAQASKALSAVSSKTPVTAAQLQALYNSPVYHIVELLISAVFLGVLGLLLGVIGGATARRQTEREAM